MSEPERIPLARPEVGPREEELVLEVLRSGRLSLGPMQERFERSFAAFLGVEDAVAVSSGTAALHLGVRALGWGPGDEVLTSPFSFVASSNCLLYEGATPVFCDIDPETLNVSAAAAAGAAGPRTAGILGVDIFGRPADWPALEKLAEERGLGLLDDACEALGASDSEGVRLGARGIVSTFAFYANKQLTTGEGGMVIPRNAAEAERMRSERNQGRAPDMAWLDHDRLGFNYRLSEIAAAVGVAQLERLDSALTAREKLAGAYAEALSGIDGLELPGAGASPERRGWFVYVVLLPEEADRDAVVDSLGGDGIEAKAYLPCIHLMPHYRDRFGFEGGEFPVAEAVSARSLALPFFPAMSAAMVDRVQAALRSALSAR